MASSSSKRENARDREEMAAITNDAIMFVEMAKDSHVNSKFLLDKATEAMGKVYHSLRTSTKQDKVTRDQITGEITTCDPKHKDGHHWEKYGTKKIKEFNDNPKDYYNCSNKRKNGCPAKKHVQQVNSHEYHVSYYGSHTCGGNQNHHQQQQHHSPALVRSEHGSASTVQIPNISSSIRATPPHEEPAGQSDEVDDYFASLEISELDGIFPSLQASQNDSLYAQFQSKAEEFKSDVLWF